MSAEDEGATVPDPSTSSILSIESTRIKNLASVLSGSELARTLFPSSSAKETSTSTFSKVIWERPLLMVMCASNACRSSVSSCGYKEIALTALQHHEKLDGSGYPYGTTSIKETAQIVGFIDCYEALTNDDRPYRNAMAPLKTLKLMKQDVESDKFSRKLFEKFAYSLV